MNLNTYTFGFGHGTRTCYDFAGALQKAQEHWDKYAEMAKKHGVTYAGNPATVEEVKAALEAGDWHLNSFALRGWDRASAYLVGRENLQGHGMSIAEGVCTLKHAAKVAAGCVRPRDPSAVVVTTFCNRAHLLDGRPLDHECFVLPPEALRAEDAEDYQSACDLLNGRELKPHSGVRRS